MGEQAIPSSYMNSHYPELAISCSPFHAAVGILTTRMLINIRKATSQNVIQVGGSDVPQTGRRLEKGMPHSSDSQTLGSWRVAEGEHSGFSE